MKRYIIIIFVILFPSYSYSQSEVPSDSLATLNKQYKQYGDFILDMSLFSILPPTLPKVSLELPKNTVNYNELFQLDKMPIYSSFYSSPTFSTGGYYELYNRGGIPMRLQSKSFQINDNLRLNTFGQYNERGQRISSPNSLPWQRNDFMGGFELKSNKGFGIRIEVRKENRNPYSPF